MLYKGKTHQLAMLNTESIIGINNVVCIFFKHTPDYFVGCSVKRETFKGTTVALCMASARLWLYNSKKVGFHNEWCNCARFF